MLWHKQPSGGRKCIAEFYYLDVDDILALLTQFFISVEAYLVLLAVSIPTLRPILKSKKSSTPYDPRTQRNALGAGGSRGVATKAGNSALTDSHSTAPFERLWEPPTLMNNTDISDGEEADSYNLQACKGGGRALNITYLYSEGQGSLSNAHHQSPDYNHDMTTRVRS